MTTKELHQIILHGENETTEFKQSFSKSAIETLVAFSNHKGGSAIIGVDDNKKVKDGFAVTLHKERSDRKTDRKNLQTDQKTDQEIIMGLIRANKHITLNEISKAINKGMSATKERITKLKNENLIKRTGSAKGGHRETMDRNDDKP